MNVLYGLRKTVASVPEKLAFADENRAITYRDFDLETTKLAYSFRNELNLKKGQRLILAVPPIALIASSACMEHIRQGLPSFQPIQC